MDGVSIATLIIIHRELGSCDESASDTEQADKILYYYPESTPLSIQLGRCNMIEGLIDFFTKFSDDSDSLHDVLMENHIWSFLMCDGNRSIWIVAAIPSQSTSSRFHRNEIIDNDDQHSLHGLHSRISSITISNTSSLSQSSNSSALRMYSMGLRSSLIKFYRLYTLFHPTIFQSITNQSDSWNVIKQVQSLRKSSRKLFDQLQQCFLDAETIKSRKIESAIKVSNTGHDRKYLEEHEENVDKIDRNNTVHSIDTIFNVMEDFPRESDLDSKIDNDRTELSSITVITKSEAERENEAEIERENESIESQNKVAIEESLGMKTGYKTLEQIEEEILSLKSQIQSYSLDLDKILSDPYQYTPSVTSKNLFQFCRWYLRSGELFFPSSLQCMPGIQVLSLGFNTSPALIRIRQLIEEFSKRLSKGCMILYDGHVVWSDVDETMTYLLYEYIRIQESISLQDSLRENITDKLSRYDALNELMISSDQPGGPKKRADIEWAKEMKCRRGIIVEGWNQVDLEDDPLSLPKSTLDSNPTSLLSTSQQIHKISELERRKSLISRSSIHDEAFQDTSYDCTSDHSYTPYKIFTPTIRFPAPRSKSRSKSEKINYNQQLNSTSSYIPNLASDKIDCINSHDTKELEVEHNSTLIHSRGIFYRQGRFIILCFIEDFDNEAGPAFLKNHSESFGNRSSFSSPDSGFGMNVDDIMWPNQGEQRFLSLCGNLQRGLCSELTLLEKLLESTSFSDSTSSNTSHSTSSNLSNITNISDINTLKKMNNILDNRRAMGSWVLPKYAKAIYSNAISRITKTSGLCNYLIDPVIIWPQVVIHPFKAEPNRVGGIHGSSNNNNNNNNNNSNNNNNNSNSSSYSQSQNIGRSTVNIMASTLSDLLIDLRAKFPFSNGLITASMDPAIIKAINSMYSILTDTTINTNIKLKPGSVLSSNNRQACIRLRSANRGGVWLVGKRSNHRILLLVVEKCDTLNEMNDVIQQIHNGAFADIII